MNSPNQEGRIILVFISKMDGSWTIEYKIVLQGGEKRLIVNLEIISELDPNTKQSFEYTVQPKVVNKYNTLFMGEEIFLLPSNILLSSPLIRCRKMEEDTDTIVSWEMHRNTEDSYSIEEAFNTFILSGKFTKCKVKSKYMELVITTPMELEENIEKISQSIVIICEYFEKIFGQTFLTQQLVSIYVDKGIYSHDEVNRGRNFKNAILVPISDVNTLFDLDFLFTISHELFHNWNGIMLRPKTLKDYWFMEGISAYYALLGIYMSNIVAYSSQESLITKYYTYIETELNKNISLYEVEEISSILSPHQGIYYSKGAVVAHLMNQEIVKKTGGEKNLHSLLQYLLKQFREYSTDDILKSVNAITDSNFEEFFRKFIYGTDRIEKNMLEPVFQIQEFG